MDHKFKHINIYLTCYFDIHTYSFGYHFSTSYYSLIIIFLPFPSKHFVTKSLRSHHGICSSKSYFNGKRKREFFNLSFKREQVYLFPFDNKLKLWWYPNHLQPLVSKWLTNHPKIQAMPWSVSVYIEIRFVMLAAHTPHCSCGANIIVILVGQIDHQRAKVWCGTIKMNAFKS